VAVNVKTVISGELMPCSLVAERILELHVSRVPRICFPSVVRNTDGGDDDDDDDDDNNNNNNNNNN
jgi:hypothetical protein